MARVFSLWIGSQLSIYEKITLVSAQRFGHEFTLFCYEPIEVPDGIIIADANDIIPIDQVRKINNSFASFSNQFRYMVLQTNQFDAWVDMDIVFNSENLSSNMDYIFGFENTTIINNAVLGYPGSSELSRKLIQSSTHFEKKWGGTGPALLTKLIQQEGLSSHIQKRETFYPIDPWEVNLLLSPGRQRIVQEKIKRSQTIHLWMDILKRFGFNNTKLPPRNSYMRTMLQDFGLLDLTLPTISLFELLRWRYRFQFGKCKHFAATVGRKMLRNKGFSG
jgi:hypothetical protein